MGMGELFMTIDELRARIGTADAPVIYDVRRPVAFGPDPNVLPTARWRDHMATGTWAARIPAGRDVVVYCVHGHNVSQLAAARLRETGHRACSLAGGIEAWRQAGHPLIRKAGLPGRDETEASIWVTRVRPKIDRIACPWLIRRFIDAEAKFLFVEPEFVKDVAGECGGIAYDIEGVDLTHRGEGCSFDTLLDELGLDDAALRALALIVRGADTGRPDLAPEAAGLLAVSLGISALSGGDDAAALARGFPVYDALYAWLRHAHGETHGWPPRRST
jgi:rhodanese-related sulfurtransferase